MNNSPVKISNINSDICIVNLKSNQNLILNLPYKNYEVKTNSSFLEINKNNNYFLIKNNYKIKEDYCFLGNVDVFFNLKIYFVCIYLKNYEKNIIKIINPNNSKLRINSNKILEINLYSTSNEIFTTNLHLDVIEYFIDSNIHKIWIRLDKIRKEKIIFKNNYETYTLYLSVKNKPKSNIYFIRNILARKL